MYNFEFECPAAITQAAQFLQQEDTEILAGGQTLIPVLKQRLSAPKLLVSLQNIKELNKISVDKEKNTAHIGSMVTHRDIAIGLSQSYPALSALAGQIGDPAVRNRGTLGGSLANNDPSACYPAAVLASNSCIITNQRTIAAQDYFQGMFTTALHAGEIVMSIQIDIPQRASYQKLTQPASRFALAGVFVVRYSDNHLISDNIRVAITGVSQGGVFRWGAAEAALSKEFTPGALVNLDPRKACVDGIISDVHANADYRASLMKTLSMRAVSAMV